MVRIGEFSPLNPNLNSGRPLLGLGEYEERRKALLEQKKREYFNSMEQARLLAKSGQVTGKNVMTKDADADFIMLSPRQVTLRSISTQTNIQELEQNLSSITTGVQQTQVMESPLECDTNYDKEMKQNLYREELRKQIEENQKLEAMKREKEKLEEALLEARIQKQQEDMAKQYEEELAMRQKKREQQEALHQCLAEMQQETIEYREKLWKQRQQELKLKISNQVEEILLDSESLERSKELKNCNSKELLLEKRDRAQNVASLNFSSENVKSVGHIEQKNIGHKRSTPVHDLPALRLKSSKFHTHLTSGNVDAENALSELMTSKEKMHMINQNIRDAIPLIPQTACVTPIPSAVHRQRTNSETLDDKWQVPVVEKYVWSPLEKNSKPSGRVLTQLGAFRKQLQQERLLLQQKLCHSRNSS